MRFFIWVLLFRLNLIYQQYIIEFIFFIEFFHITVLIIIVIIIYIFIIIDLLILFFVFIQLFSLFSQSLLLFRKNFYSFHLLHCLEKFIPILFIILFHLLRFFYLQVTLLGFISSNSINKCLGIIIYLGFICIHQMRKLQI